MELTKVYVVQVDNCEDYDNDCRWIEGVFASKESAEKYIFDEERRYDEDMRRNCWSKAWRCYPRYWIREYSVNN